MIFFIKLFEQKRKKEKKKKDNKIIKLIKRFIKDMYYKYGKTKIKKVQLNAWVFNLILNMSQFSR